MIKHLICFLWVLHLIFFGLKNSRTTGCTNISSRNITISYLLCSFQLRLKSMFFILQWNTEIVSRRWSVKKVLLKIFLNWQKNRKNIRRRCFPGNFAKFLRELSYRVALVAASENGVITIWLTTLTAVVKFPWTWISINIFEN